MKKTKMLIIFDKDNTLVRTLDKRPPNNLEEQVFFPGVIEKCAQLRADGHILALATNQGGAAFGHFTAEQAHFLVADAAKKIGAVTYALCVCHPHGSVPSLARESNFRKPNPGMLLYLMDTLGARPDETMYVGDRDEDQLTAKRAKVKFAWADKYFNRENG